MFLTLCGLCVSNYSWWSEGGEFRTKSRIQHVESHLVALLCAGDSNQSLIAVILRLVDLDDTSTELSDLVDLSSTLTNDGTNHVVWNEDLLG